MDGVLATWAGTNTDGGDDRDRDEGPTAGDTARSYDAPPTEGMPSCDTAGGFNILHSALSSQHSYQVGVGKAQQHQR